MFSFLNFAKGLRSPHPGSALTGGQTAGAVPGSRLFRSLLPQGCVRASKPQYLWGRKCHRPIKVQKFKTSLQAIRSQLRAGLAGSREKSASAAAEEDRPGGGGPDRGSWSARARRGGGAGAGQAWPPERRRRRRRRRRRVWRCSAGGRFAAWVGAADPDKRTSTWNPAAAHDFATQRRRCCCGTRARGPAGPRTAGRQGAGAAGRDAPGRWAGPGRAGGDAAAASRRGPGCSQGGAGSGGARRASRHPARRTRKAPAVVMEIVQPSGFLAVASLENDQTPTTTSRMTPRAASGWGQRAAGSRDAGRGAPEARSRRLLGASPGLDLVTPDAEASGCSGCKQNRVKINIHLGVGPHPPKLFLFLPAHRPRQQFWHLCFWYFLFLWLC